VDAATFRSEFPVLATRAYLNTGSDGPVPTRSVEAARAQLEREAVEGRSGAAHSIALRRMAEDLRARLGALLGAGPDDVALTGSTTDGINVVLAGLGLGPNDEVLTSDEEHPGLLAPLAALRERSGALVRVAPFDEIANAVGERTRLIAVSHVSWLRGAVAPVEELHATGVPVLLDGAQALGAMPVDVRELGCDFYAAAGQKWLCGPDRTGVLYVEQHRVGDLGVPWPSFMSLADPEHPLDLVPAPGARRFDGGMIAGPLVAGALASLAVLEEAGWPWIFERAAEQAAKLRVRLAEEGVEVLPGGRTTLVSWRPGGVSDASGAIGVVQRLAERGVIVRALPGKPWVRASVGAWNSDEDLDRLLAGGT
jgi:selenocysteine lyase/cysteine desulfurase